MVYLQSVPQVRQAAADMALDGTKRKFKFPGDLLMREVFKEGQLHDGSLGFAEPVQFSVQKQPVGEDLGGFLPRVCLTGPPNPGDCHDLPEFPRQGGLGICNGVPGNADDPGGQPCHLRVEGAPGTPDPDEDLLRDVISRGAVTQGTQRQRVHQRRELPVGR
ncbi:MAG: hypothetical protein NVS2B15_15370 [Pseudarthrobacter sp.]